MRWLAINNSCPLTKIPQNGPIIPNHTLRTYIATLSYLDNTNIVGPVAEEAGQFEPVTVLPPVTQHYSYAPPLFIVTPESVNIRRAYFSQFLLTPSTELPQNLIDIATDNLQMISDPQTPTVEPDLSTTDSKDKKDA